MTPTFLRRAIVLALALSLAACGGKATFPLSGTVSGLTYEGLVLTSNGMDLAVPAKSTTFTFPSQLSYGDVYAVTQKTKPAHQDCSSIIGGADTAGRLATINVTVTCTVNSAAVGGTVTGLKSAGLVLTNGSSGGTVAPVPSADGSAVVFTLPSTVPYGVTYGITVLAQPATETCTVGPNGTAVMGDDAVANIVVTCQPN
ncbi:MAG: hypothetical protein JWQ01_1114 [Massilia sp.]|nr:hypothetical protein [Massilia sp.]